MLFFQYLKHINPVAFTSAANLATTALSKQLAENVCGVYIGWAGLANHGVYKMVMNIGWSPYFDNAEKTVVSLEVSSQIHHHHVSDSCYVYEGFKQLPTVQSSIQQ